MSVDERLARWIQLHLPAEVALLSRLIQANSANGHPPGTLLPERPIEAAAAHVVWEQLRQLGLAAELCGVSPLRPNVLARLGPGGGRTLIATTHLDTVPPAAGWTHDPWQPRQEAGQRLSGLGAADAKAQVTALVFAACAWQALPPRQGQVVLAFVADEESGACSPLGTAWLLKQGWLQGDGVLLGEPGDRQLTLGHRGLWRFRLRLVRRTDLGADAAHDDPGRNGPECGAGPLRGNRRGAVPARLVPAGSRERAATSARSAGDHV